MTQQTVHRRLQEYCDAYAGSNPAIELERLAGHRKARTDSDETEVALRTLALYLLAAVERHAAKVCLTSNIICVTSAASGICATAPADVVSRACGIVSEMAGLAEPAPHKKGVINLRLRGDELPLSVEDETANAGSLTIGLPACA